MAESPKSKRQSSEHDDINDFGSSTNAKKQVADAACVLRSSPQTITTCSLRELVQAGVSRRIDFPLVKTKAALLIIDVQKYCCEKKGTSEYYANESLPRMLSNIQLLIKAFRKHRDETKRKQGCEVIFTMIQSATNDGRDISLDYKLSGPYFCKLPKVNDSFEDIFLPSLLPDTTSGKGDVVIPKTACSVFHSTNIDFVLRNLHAEQLVIVGQLTEQCVESAVRNAADMGYFVTLVQDSCAAHSLAQHERGLSGMAGFCRILTTHQVIKELES